jgi:S1-C subfamily serine protease
MKNLIGFTTRVGGLALLLAIAGQGTAGADMRETARRVAAEKGDAVLTLLVVSEVSFSYQGSSQRQEDRRETSGIVISEDGLVVTALSSVDPTGMIERMSGTVGEDPGFTTTLKDVKYILADNTEVPATLVLRDNDFDLAFLRPLQPPASPMTAIDLTDSVEPQLLDEIFTLARLGRIARRTVAAMSGEIQAIVTRPRTYYITDGETVSGSTGNPVFAADGKIVGIVLYHVLAGASQSTSNEESILPVVIPAADILEVAANAPKTATPAAPAAEAAPAEEQAPAAPES